MMCGGCESARAERLAFVTKRCWGVVLAASTALIAISAQGPLTLGPVQAADLNNTGVIDNTGARTQNVATNTGTINNDSGGTWTGNVFTKPGAPNKNPGAPGAGQAKNTAATHTNAGHQPG